ncbi:MAG: hypothetical protein SV422_06105 [Pseudomonadota bacterium]|nr:hypothetical protein [Pseudomonadota bacterium]
MTLLINCRRLALLMCCCALAACTTDDAPEYQTSMQTPPVASPPQLVTLYVPTPVPAASDQITPLDYYAWAQAAPAEELYAEQLQLSLPDPEANALIDKVHLGILMSVSAIASRDSEREAMELLQTIDAANVDDASRGYAVFADFLLNHLEQRKELRAATTNVATSREELETLQHSNAQLQQKIDALTRIEEQLIEREQAQGERIEGERIESEQTDREQIPGIQTERNP